MNISHYYHIVKDTDFVDVSMMTATVGTLVSQGINRFQKKGGPPCQPPLGLFPTILSLNQRTFAPCFDSQIPNQG